MSQEKKGRLECPYCHSPILGAFTLDDHFYSHFECSKKAKVEKLIPQDAPVSWVTMFG